MTLNASIISQYARDQHRRNLARNSIDRYRCTLRSLARHHGDRSLLDLTRDDIETWVDAVPRAPRSRYQLISCVCTFYEWAIAREYLDVNPTRKIERPKLKRQLPRPIGHDDLAVAVRVATPMIRCWLLLAALGGLRCQEISGLRREDVWDHEAEPVLIVTKPKGGNERIVPLHPDVHRALRTFGIPRNGHVFINFYGRPFTPERVSHLGNAHLRALGIDATMHQIRHRFGTDVYAISNDIRVTQELLGHQSPAPTAGYTAISPGRAVDVVRQLAI